jgi:hypothetical protein
VIDPSTGALVLPGPGGDRIDRTTTRATFLGSPRGLSAACDHLGTPWMHVRFALQTAEGLALIVVLHFEGEDLHGYSLSIDDPRYGTSWDDVTEAKQLAQRDAHDAGLVAALGPGSREASPRGAELYFVRPWGAAWSTFDARGGGSTIGVRFARF